MGSAIINVFMGFSSGLLTLTVFWIFNAWFQSMGWPPAARMLTQWFSPSEIGTKWALWASSHQIGAAAILTLSGYLLTSYGWRSVFWIPGLIAAILAIFAFDRLRDNPKELGFPPVEEYKKDVIKMVEDERRLSFKEVMPLVLKNKWVWCAAVANMFLYIPRMGIFIWAPTFLKEYKGVDIMVAGWQVAGFEVAGLIGGVFAGWVSDHIFQGRRGPVGAIFLGVVSIFLLLLWITPIGYAYLDALFLIFSGFLIYGPQVLAGLAAADFVPKKAVGVSTGITGTMAYVGGAISGYGIGKTVDVWGWHMAFMLFIVAALLGSFFFALTWHQRAKVLEDAHVEEI
jgi:sugar phosphate permease